MITFFHLTGLGYTRSSNELIGDGVALHLTFDIENASPILKNIEEGENFLLLLPFDCSAVQLKQFIRLHDFI